MQLNSRNLSHLFTVRLWFESSNQSSQVARIQVHHILSGNVRTFRGWVDTVNFMLAESQASEPIGIETEKIEFILQQVAGPREHLHESKGE